MRGSAVLYARARTLAIICTTSAAAVAPLLCRTFFFWRCRCLLFRLGAVEKFSLIFGLRLAAAGAVTAAAYADDSSVFSVIIT